MEEAALRETDLILGAVGGFGKAFTGSLDTEAERVCQSESKGASELTVQEDTIF